MAAYQSGVFNIQDFTGGGALGVGMRLYTYAYGTTTHKTAYTDAAGSVAHTYTADGSGGQYLALNARGELPAPLYLLTGSYDLALKDSAGASVRTRRADPNDDLGQLAASGGSVLVGFVQSGAGAKPRTLQDKGREDVSVTDYYANGGSSGPMVDPTGVIDSYLGIQAACNAALGVYFPGEAANYTVSVPIQLRRGQVLRGESAHTTITNSVVNGGIFWMTPVSPAYSSGMAPVIENMTLVADVPIKFNDEAELITGTSATTPYLMRPVVRNVTMTAAHTGTGVGLAMSKCFDPDISCNTISGFSINILTQGTDIGCIRNNRLNNSKDWAILEISCAGFGSSTEIAHNDIVGLKGGTVGTPHGVAIQSCGLHPRIHDNFIEADVNTYPAPFSTAYLSGAINLTNIGITAYGSNTPTTPKEIVCVNNRIDTQLAFVDYVYKLDGIDSAIAGVTHSAHPTAVRLHDNGSTFNTTPSNYLLVNGGKLPTSYGSTSWKACQYDISLFSGLPFKYNRFQTGRALQISSGVTIGPENYDQLNFTSWTTGNAGLYLSYDGNDSIVISSGITAIGGYAYFYLPPTETGSAHPLTVGFRYIAHVVAKSASAETVSFGLKSGATASAVYTVALTAEWVEYTLGSVVAPAAASTLGFFVYRAAATATVEIKSIRWERVLSGRIAVGTPLGGSAMTAGQTITSSITVVGAVGGMAVAVAPLTYPGAGFVWDGYIPSADVVTIRLTCVAAGTPTASVYAACCSPASSWY